MLHRLHKYGPLLLLLILICSCGNDETSYQTKFCVVQERGDNTLYLHSDDGQDLNPISSLNPSIYEEDQRFRVTYIEMEGNKTLTAETGIEVVEMLPVKLITVGHADKSFNDPIWLVVQPWIGGGFLNFEFTFNYARPEIKHGIFLVQDSLVQEPEGGKIYLSFKHDSNEDGSSLQATAFASAPLSSISGLEKADSLIVSVQEGRVKTKYRLAVKK